MFKKILIGMLVVIVIAAAASSIYSTVSARNQVAGTNVATGESLGNGYGAQANGANGSGTGTQARGANGTGTGVPDPQNGLTEWVTYSGVVSAYAAPKFSLITADGQSIPAEIGNLNYATELGLALKDGDAVTVIGFWDANGGLALKSLTLDSTGQTFTFRDDTGRPSWAGGQGGQGGQGHTTP
jgi:hypothetical protein